MPVDIDNNCFEKITVVVLDDDENITRLIKEQLEEFNIITANSSEEFREKINDLLKQKINIDCLLLDIFLKEGHILAKNSSRTVTIHEIKNNLSDVPVILTTSTDIHNQKKIIEGLDLEGIIKKPFDIYDIRKMILNSLNKKNSGNEEQIKIHFPFNTINNQKKKKSLESTTKETFQISDFENMCDNLTTSEIAQKGQLKFPPKSDWKINRINELSELFGITPVNLHLLALYISREFSLNGNEKMISLNLGPGDGSILEHLRNVKLMEDHSNFQLSDYFEFFGISDYFYTNLYNLFHKYIKKEYKENKYLDEFVLVVSNIIAHKTELLSPSDISTNEVNNTLISLHEDLNTFRNILLNLNKFIQKGVKNIHIGIEFPDDNKKRISKKCQEFLDKAFECPENFYCEYFENDFMDGSYDLNKGVKIHTKNIALMDFLDIDKKFPETECFNIITPGKSTSHLVDKEYEEVMDSLLKRLREGGLIMAEGAKESYTRYYRINIIKNLLNKDCYKDSFKAYMITNNDEFVSILIQKKIPDDKIHYPTESFPNIEMYEACINKELSIIPLDEIDQNCQKALFKNNILHKIRQKIIFNSKDRASVYPLRYMFKNIHNILNKNFELIFDSEDWIKYLQSDDLSTKNDLQILLEDTAIGKADKIIQSRVGLMLNNCYKDNIIPDNVMVESIPYDGNIFPTNENKKRIIQANTLPTNSELNLDRRKEDLIKLSEVLKEIENITMKAPITIIQDYGDESNILLQNSLMEILGDEFHHKIRVLKLDNLSNEIIKTIENTIVIINGSFQNGDLDQLKSFSNTTTKSLIQNLDSNNIRLIGSCFGSHSILQALGLTPKKGAMEFGLFPVRISGKNYSEISSFKTSSPKHERIITSLITNNTYFDLNESENFKRDNDLKVLGYGYSWADIHNTGEKLSPYWMKLLKSRVIISKMMLGIDISNPEHRKILIKMIPKFSKNLIQNHDHPIENIMKQNIDFNIGYNNEYPIENSAEKTILLNSLLLLATQIRKNLQQENQNIED